MSAEITKVGIISCSGEAIPEGTISRLATLRVLELLRPMRLSRSVCRYSSPEMKRNGISPRPIRRSPSTDATNSAPSGARKSTAAPSVPRWW